MIHEFSEAEKSGLYRVIHERRDIRAHFKPDPIPPKILTPILEAAHHAVLTNEVLNSAFDVCGEQVYRYPDGFCLLRNRKDANQKGVIHDRMSISSSKGE